MDEQQNALKGQGFTLLVFGGLVALCSVFFILGMIVGRGQSAAPPDPEQLTASAQPLAGEEDELALDFYEEVGADEEVQTEEPRASAPPEPILVPAPSEPRDLRAAEVGSSPPDLGDQAVLLQLAAFGSEAPAQRMVTEVREKGFAAFLLRPSPADGGSTFFRVQVGPYTSGQEADQVRARLQAEGYEVVPVR